MRSGSYARLLKPVLVGPHTLLRGDLVWVIRGSPTSKRLLIRGHGGAGWVDACDLGPAKPPQTALERVLGPDTLGDEKAP